MRSLSAFTRYSLPLALLVTIGCSPGNSVATPQPGELDTYLQANPDAPRSSSEEPAGIEGPTSLPGEAEG